LDVDLNGMENAKMIIKSFLLDHREISWNYEDILILNE
jgi:hypothetical protein